LHLAQVRQVPFSWQLLNPDTYIQLPDREASLTIDSADSWRLLCASACTDPALSFYVAYHFMAELLFIPLASILLQYQ
ncbi:unnamed protein product, partial [Staurois parvus]